MNGTAVNRCAAVPRELRQGFLRILQCVTLCTGCAQSRYVSLKRELQAKTRMVNRVDDNSSTISLVMSISIDSFATRGKLSLS